MQRQPKFDNTLESRSLNYRMPCIELVFACEAINGPIGLPPFIGPTLRGAFGFTLKDLVCIVPHRSCDRCQFIENCTYPRLFDGRLAFDSDDSSNQISEGSVARPGRTDRRVANPLQTPMWLPIVPPLSSPKSERHLTFGFRLFGPAIPLWPYVVEAVKISVQKGLGSEKNRFRLIGVRDGSNGKELYEKDQINEEPQTFGADTDPIPDRTSSLRWHFLTPLQLKKDNQQTAFIDPLDLILSGRRRWQNMLQAAGVPLSDEPEVRLEREHFKTSDIKLQTWGFSRFSGRQKQSMNLFGAVGSVTFTGPWHQAGQWLSAVHHIHLGGKTAFGFGQVKWEII